MEKSEAVTHRTRRPHTLLVEFATILLLLGVEAGVPSTSVAQQTIKPTPKTQAPSASAKAPQKKPSLEELRQKYLKNKRTVAGQKIINPQAAQKFNSSPTISALQMQFQFATSERSAIQQAAKLPVATPNNRDASGPDGQKIKQSGCKESKTIVGTINGKMGGTIFTPDPQYNLYTIKGCNFGTQQGQLHLYGHFHAAQIAMTVNYWSQDSIIASIDPNVQGESDQDDVHLVLIPADGQQIDLGGQKFYAVRETVTLQTIPQSWVKFGQAVDSGHSVVPPSYTANMMSAQVVRLSGDRFGGGPQDYFDFSQLKPGFTTQNMQLTSFPPGCTDSSDTYYDDGPFQAQWDGDNVRVIIGAETCHVSGELFVSGYDTAISAYVLTVQVSGPRGVDPLN